MAGDGPRSPLGFWQIWNMTFGFLSIQFGWALQMANMSAIYEYLGADDKCRLNLVLGEPQPAITEFSMSLNAAFGGANTALVIGLP